MFSLDPRGGHNRYQFNKDFFKKWTPEMAYVLGFMYADGNITNSIPSRTQYTNFYSSDKEILEKIKYVLSSEHPIEVILPKTRVYQNGIYTSKKGFRLRIGSREMYQDLLNLGLTPKKSLTITFPDNIPHKYFNDFVRGYFDGDGCITIKRGTGKYGQKILKGVAVIFTSGSEAFLIGLRDKAISLKGLGKRSVYYSKSSRAYYLKYDTFESLTWFKNFYKTPTQLFLERKFNVFKKYFEMRPIRVDKKIAEILKENMAEYPSSLRRGSAKPLYMGANPISASKM